jgi:predicted RNase H-like HicB family nuclease
MKNTIFAYPAIFKPDEDCYSVYFPDLPGCTTYGETIEEAFAYAKDALGGWLSGYLERNPVPAATPIKEIHEGEDEFVMLIEVDSVQLAAAMNKSVKTNTTIPLWLKTAAEKRGLNFSAVLQKGLLAELEN